jgi:hypothetical protein
LHSADSVSSPVSLILTTQLSFRAASLLVHSISVGKPLFPRSFDHAKVTASRKFPIFGVEHASNGNATTEGCLK